MNREFIGSMPSRIATLPRDARGYPVPKFVEWIDGVPDFRIASSDHMARCVKQRRCWICGEQTGTHMAFVIGPMCCVNRVSAEPPSHYDCARFAAVNCPFLSHPLAKRPGNDDLAKFKPTTAGHMIDRNPGVCAVWVTKRFKPFRAGNGVLFEIGDPERVEFYAKGRAATRDEIDHSVDTGLPLLADMARKEGEPALLVLQKQQSRFGTLLERFAS